MTAIQKWLAWLAVTFVAVTVSWQWFDRPIATFAHRRTVQHETFAQVTHIPDPFIPAAVIVFLVLGLWIYSGRPLPKLAATALLCGISAIVSDATKALLKYGFGRTWPETWVQNNPSFVRDGVFGFNFFHGGPGYASFPSGHMALTCSVLSVLWIAYPKFRLFYAAVVLAVAVGLVGANYHFFSDIFAGSFVGSTVGILLTAIWQRRADAKR